MRVLQKTGHLGPTARQRLHECRHRGDSGLTTLEWLLIVAAVAGLAALAVVLVTNVVGDTSEQISGQNARLTAARVAAEEITIKARAVTAADDADTTDSKHASKLNAKYKSDCKELAILYGDIDGLGTVWNEDITTDPLPTMDHDVADKAEWDGDTQGCLITT